MFPIKAIFSLIHFNLPQLFIIMNKIININVLYRTVRYVHFFCNIPPQKKEQVLKTYLQVIPPYRLQTLIEPNKLSLSKSLETAKQRNLTEQQLTEIDKRLKKNIQMMKIEHLSALVEHLYEGDGYKELKVARKVYNRIVESVRRKIDVLSIEQLANFVYVLVKSGKKEFELMKAVENVIIEEKIKVDYPVIRKILWAYTHLDAGSATLYSHICKTIRVGQYELAALQLAQSAYMLSKVSQNATGGYGIFTIAEKHIQNHLPRLDFSQLVKAASFMLTQNIGSNSFQLLLEQELYKKYPNKANLRTNDLVALLKSTCSYYFKFNENALLHMLKRSTERHIEDATIEQFEDMIWSWGRAGKGDKDLWTLLQEKTLKVLGKLKPRQMAFFYYSLSCSEHSSPSTLSQLEQAFLQLNLQHVPQHYLLKFLLGMEKKKSYNSQVFTQLTQRLCKQIQQLSNREFITLVKILNDSDIDYENKEMFGEVVDGLVVLVKALQKKLYLFKISDIVEILYLWVKLDIQTPTFMEKMFLQLENVMDIPKNVWIKAFFCFTIKDKHQKMFEMLPILMQLRKYGPIGYFFSPHILPLLGYCLFHISVNGKGEFSIPTPLLSELSQHMQQIEGRMLNRFIGKAHNESLNLMQKIRFK